MNKSLLRLLNVNTWSMRRKLLLAIGVALLLPLTVVFGVLEAGAAARDLATNQAYINEVGEERRQQVDSALDLAIGALDALTSNLRYRRDIVTVMEGNATREQRQALVDLFTDRLILTDLYIDVRVINPQGVATANTLSTRSTTQLNGTSLTDTPGYLAGVEAQILREDQRIAIYAEETGEVYIDLVQVLYYADRSLAGFIVTTMNTPALFTNNLTPRTGFIPLISYLTTQEGLLITSADTLPLAQSSRSRAGLQAALTTATTLTYADGQAQFAVHIDPIERTRLTLVTETLPIQGFNSPINDFFVGNGTLLIVVVVVLWAFLVAGLNWIITAPVMQLRGAMEDISRGDYNTQVAFNRGDELGNLMQAFVGMRAQIRETLTALDTRMADRVRDIQATQEISRAAASQRDLDTLMNEVVTLIINTFPNIYHAQIFLIDSDGRYAMLRASTGEAGRNLLERGHRLLVGSTSVIGGVTGEGRTIIARDTTASSVHKRNEFLPDTRAELAIPLRVGKRIIGALDVQSRRLPWRRLQQLGRFGHAQGRPAERPQAPKTS
ncbi:MAG: HAMP domain-containing protein, partial [Armatimonadetes bacterium]|nr:HAMP domain-containing protein [Anaerolineae bacterium]